MNSPQSADAEQEERAARTVRSWSACQERAAAVLLGDVLGGVPWLIDRGGGVQLHDVEVDLPDGSTIAIEVTSHVEQTETETLAAIQARDWNFAGLRFAWNVSVVPHARVGDLHTGIAAALGTLEHSGIADWVCATSSPPPDEQQEFLALHQLGVRQVFPIPGLDAGTVRVTAASKGGSVAAEDMTRAALAEMSKPDNVSKLDHAACDRRALFIWVDPSGPVSAAMSLTGSPSAASPRRAL